jgi:transcriptional regulator with XRE-family HTH domain
MGGRGVGLTPKDFRRIRLALGLSQTEMGRELGKSIRQVRYYETGHTDIPLLVARAVEAMERDEDGKHE